MRVVACALAGSLFIGGPGCASTDQLEMELSRVRREVYGLRVQLDETRREVEHLTGRVTLLSADRKVPVAAAVNSVARPVSAVPAAPMPNLPVVRLGGQAPDTEDAQGNAVGAVDDGSPPVMIKLGPSSAADKLTVDRAVLAKPDPVLDAESKPATRVDMATEYQRALQTLRKDERPDEARKLFEAFLSRHADSSLGDNAAYWLAECSHREGHYTRAVDEFLRVVERYPKSTKVPDALLRVAQSWQALGNPTKAAEVFRRIAERYPQSEAAHQAKKALES